MKLLLVEDDENKCSQILCFVAEGLGIHDVEVAGSYRRALDKMDAHQFDLILLDMTLPTYEIDLDEEGGRPRAFAGRDVLRQMERRGITTPAIVITQFDKFGEHGEAKTRAQLHNELAKAHSVNYRGMVYYDTAVESWKEELGRIITHLKPKAD